MKKKRVTAASGDIQQYLIRFKQTIFLIRGTKMTQPKKAAATSKIVKGKIKKTSAAVKTPPAAFPIVGIGASAGGLEALEQFLANVPENCGMAFVVI